MPTIANDPIAKLPAAQPARQPFNLLIVTTHPDEADGPCEVARVPCEFGIRGLLIDLSEVTRIDSWGLALFVEAMQRITALGGHLIIFGMCENVLRVFETSKLDQVIQVCASREEAMAELHPAESPRSEARTNQVVRPLRGDWKKLLSLGFFLLSLTSSLAGDPAPRSVDSSAEEKLHAPYYLTGDWGGLRPSLESRGVTFDLFETFDFYGNVSGGQYRALEYFARTRLTLEVDLEKLLGWKGAEFFATAVTQQGEDFGKTKIGVYTNPSGIEGKQTTRLAEIWLQQKFLDDKVAIKVGKIDGVGEFGAQEFASTFMNDELNYVTNQTFTAGMPFDPAGKPGAVVLVKPFEGSLLGGSYAKAGVFAGNDNSAYLLDDTGASFAIRDPAILAAEIGWRTPKLSDLCPGAYKVGVHYNLGEAKRFDGTTADGNYFIYGSAAQTLGYLDDERTRHIDAGFTIGGAPTDRNGNHVEVTAALRAIGPWASRPKDEIGLGFIVSNFSRDLGQTGTFGRPVAGGSEKTFELSYRAQVNRWFVLQPNVQVVFDPFGDRRRDAVLLLGMRTMVVF